MFSMAAKTSKSTYFYLKKYLVVPVHKSEFGNIFQWLTKSGVWFQYTKLENQLINQSKCNLKINHLFSTHPIQELTEKLRWFCGGWDKPTWGNPAPLATQGDGPLASCPSHQLLIKQGAPSSDRDCGLEVRASRSQDLCRFSFPL